MTTEEFENTLRQFLHKEPFEPFVVELIDGQVIQIERPKLVFGGGAASFLTPSFDLVEFACEQVQTIHPVLRGVVS